MHLSLLNIMCTEHLPASIENVANYIPYLCNFGDKIQEIVSTYAISFMWVPI